MQALNRPGLTEVMPCLGQGPSTKSISLSPKDGGQSIFLLLPALSTGLLAKILLQSQTGQFLRALQTLSTGSVHYPGQYECTDARVCSVYLDGSVGNSPSLLARTRYANSRTVAKPWQFVSQVPRLQRCREFGRGRWSHAFFEGDGECYYTSRPDFTPCDDGLHYTHTDICNLAGSSASARMC